MTPKPEPHVDEWLKCPRCYNPKRTDHPGIGLVTHTRGRLRYMCCKRCGFTWSRYVDLVKKVVTIEYKVPGDLEER